MSDLIVSVVIPTYNRTGSIVDSIDSVLKQTYKNIELVIVDDASTDNTSEIIKFYNDPRIRYVRHEVNLGGGSARNTGIQISKGQYIAFLDSDDTWLPDKVNEQVKKLCDFGEQWGAVYTGYINIIDNHKSIVVPALEGRICVPMLTGEVSLASGSTLMIKRECFEKVGLFDTNISRFQDVEFMLRFFTRYKVAVVQRPLAIINRYYKIKYTSIEKDALFLISQVYNHLPRLNKEEMDRVISFIYLQLAKNLMQGCGSIVDALLYFSKAIALKANTPVREYLSFISIAGFRITGLDVRKLRK